MEMNQRIKERRLVMNYTQEELAEKLGLQKSAIAKYENGRVENIKRSIILKMATILECTPTYLMGWDEAPAAPAFPLSPKEEYLITDFRTLNEDGQDYILQTMDMVKDKYKKAEGISSLEDIG